MPGKRSGMTFQDLSVLIRSAPIIGYVVSARMADFGLCLYIRRTGNFIRVFGKKDWSKEYNVKNLLRLVEKFDGVSSQ